MTVINLDLTVDTLVQTYLNIADDASDSVEILRTAMIQCFYGGSVSIEEQLSIINALESGTELNELFEYRREAPAYFVAPAIFELLLAIALDNENMAMAEDVVNLTPATYVECVGIISRMLNSVSNDANETYNKLKIRVLSHALCHVVINHKVATQSSKTGTIRLEANENAGKNMMEIGGYLENL